MGYAIGKCKHESYITDRCVVPWYPSSAVNHRHAQQLRSLRSLPTPMYAGLSKMSTKEGKEVSKHKEDPTAGFFNKYSFRFVRLMILFFPVSLVTYFRIIWINGLAQ